MKYTVALDYNLKLQQTSLEFKMVNTVFPLFHFLSCYKINYITKNGIEKRRAKRGKEWKRVDKKVTHKYHPNFFNNCFHPHQKNKNYMRISVVESEKTT